MTNTEIVPRLSTLLLFPPHGFYICEEVQDPVSQGGVDSQSSELGDGLWDNVTNGYMFRYYITDGLVLVVVLT